MNPDELAQMLASGDKEQVKAAQKQLQALGYDVGPSGADGGLGKDTSAAIAAYRKDFADNRSTELGIAEANREASNPVNKLLGLGVDVLPYATGVGAGTALGHYGFGKPFKKSDERIGREASALARDQDIDPQEKRNQLNRMSRRRVGRDVAQFGAPALLGGAGYVTQEYIAPQVPEELQGAVRMVGTGENAAAATLGVHQMVDTLRRGNPVSNVDEARIRSQAGRGSNAVPAPQSRPLQSVEPQPSAPQPPRQALPAPQQSLPAPAAQPQEPMRHSDRLKQTVEAAGGKPGKTKSANVAAIKRGLNPDNMPAVAESLNLPRDASRPQVLQRLREISRIGGKMVLPFTAGALAVDALQPAEAADGTVSGPSTGEQAGAFAAGVGAYEGGRRAVNRLLQAVPRVAPVLNVAGPAIGAYDYASQAQEAREGMPEGVTSDLMAQATPLAMRGMEGAQAWQDLPQNTREFVARNQSDPTMGMTDEVQAMPQEAGVPMPSRGERGLLGRRDLNAANLQVPQMPAETYQEEAAPPDFDQYIADLQAIFAEMEQGQQPQRRPAQRPMPAPPPAYGGQQNRLLQPTGY